MIEARDVIRMRVPFPGIDSRLAMQSHMYICQIKKTNTHGFLKCQTLKPYMLGEQNPMKNFHDEEADLDRNPFVRTTRIDCDRIFSTKAIEYSEKMRTTNRKDICTELFQVLLNKIANETPEVIQVNEDELLRINPLAAKIK
ncbi:hypothetical protein ACKQTC_07095 [Peptococcus simiae]|uniref:Uncharacterized protein n=1 Tax=Peptococcus simiae TaxID=1643805 RepID=A0ABW9GZT8_9FIRM